MEMWLKWRRSYCWDVGFHLMCELAVVAHVVVGVARFVWSVELCRVIVHPNFELFLWGFLAEKWWSLPFVGDPADTGMVGVVGLWIGRGRVMLYEVCVGNQGNEAGREWLRDRERLREYEEYA